MGGRAFSPYVVIGLSLLAAWVGATAALAQGTVPARQGDVRTSAQGDLAAPVVHGHLLENRWVYIQNNFQVDANVDRVTGILDRAAAAGYNGALFADVKFGRLDDGSLIPAYYTNLHAVLDHARGLDMQVVPNTADFGYSESILWHDPNLAEALPVRDATFRVLDGALVPFDANPVSLVNGQFEDVPDQGDTFPGWAWQDQPGVTTFVDRSERHGGRASLRMTDIGTTNPPHGNGRIQQRLAVRPFQHYHVSVWVKTQDFSGGQVRVLALGQNPSRTLQWNDVPVERTRDWTRFDVTFNTLTHNEVLLYLGVWGGGTGTIWWDDAAIVPAGLVNTVRRGGAPVRLTSEDGSVRYDEGRDIAPVVDPLMGNSPWPGSYDLWHEPPEIAVLPGSRLSEGDVVRADWHHMVTIYGFQVTASMTEPAVYPIVRGQLESLRREFAAAGAFSGWMLGYDEIRVQGWDSTISSGGPGEDLAESVWGVRRIAREIAPDADMYTWSDMFDPFHNAAKRDAPYYLVNGDWSGSWEGLAPDVCVINWNHNTDKHRDSAAFFAGRGHEQMLAGYYDSAADRFSDNQWLKNLEGVPGIKGVLYTQWGTGYDNLEAWAEHVWGAAEWATPTPTPTGSAPPPRTPTSTPTSTPPSNLPTPTVTVAAQSIYLPFVQGAAH